MQFVFTVRSSREGERGERSGGLIGQLKALAITVRSNKSEQRFSGLLARLRAE